MTIAAPVTTPLSSLAKSALLDADGNVEDATRALIEEVKLSDLTADQVIAYGCSTLIKQANHNTRTRIWNSATARPDPVVVDNGLALMAQSTARTLLDYPLRDGTPIRFADRAAVLRDAEWITGTGKTMIQRGKWLYLIADKLTGKKTVEQVFTTTDLESLRAKAEADATAAVS